MLDSSNVRVAVTGAVYVGLTTATGPTGTTGPTTGFDDLGYVSEDGVTEARNRSTNKIKGWQNGATLREVVTEADATYHFTLVETKVETVELYYGAAVAEDGSIVIDPAQTGGRKSYIIDVIDGDDFIRTYIPEGEITEVGDQVYANGEPIGYEVTVTAYPSKKLTADGGGPGTVKKFYSSLADAA